jgi:hypothetical protein
MQMLDRIRCCTDPIPAKQSPGRYWELISAEMNVLYVLSFLLTAHKETADHCLEQTLDGFVEGVDDFLDWARTRGHEAVLEHAIFMMKPDPDATEGEMDLSDGLFPSAGDHLFGAIAAMPAFRRFVFVITTIYGKSNTECARLLGTARREVTITREVTERILRLNSDEEPPQWAGPSAPFEEDIYQPAAVAAGNLDKTQLRFAPAWALST